MKLEGSYTFEAPQDIVWDVLLDPVLLAQVLPGSEGLEPLGDDKYKATLKIQVGPVQGVFEGTVALADINKPDSYRMDINGKGAPGFVKGGGAVRLETQGTTTIMHYTGEAQVGGRIASVGQRLLESSGKALVNQSLEAINQQIKAIVAARETQKAQEAEQAKQAQQSQAASQKFESGSASGSASGQPQTSAVLVKPPSQFQFALGVARGVFADLVPAQYRPIVIAGTVVLLIILILLIIGAFPR
jgi:carbon monoxide dehydrogenase subunit G